MKIQIQNKVISEVNPVFIVAELSANHQQNFELAVKTIQAAQKAGADAIKLQTYTADTITLDCDNDCFRIRGGTLWDGKTLHQLYQEAYTPWDWQPKLKKIAEELGIICFSTPFDQTAVDFLEQMDVPAYKIASFEITDIPLIEYVASKGKPVILSTGIATLEDIELAIRSCQKMGNQQIAILKCTSSYPTLVSQVNLKLIPDLAKRFKTIVGLSDHTKGISVPIASVALGAKIIEKHFILNRTLGGPDAAFSLDPDEFSAMVKGIREIEQALGQATYELTEAVKRNRYFMRSLFVVCDIKAHEKLTQENIKSIRPGHGLPPQYWKDICGRKAKKDIKKGTPLGWELVE